MSSHNAENKGHPSANQVLENTRELLKIRGENRKPLIFFHITLHKNSEDDLMKIIEQAGKLEIAGINILRLDVRFDKQLRRPGWEEERQIVRRAEVSGKRYGIHVGSIISEYRRNWLRRWIFDLICSLTYASVYINLKGDVTPCCSLPHLEMGNILKQPLKEIWRGEQFQQFRLRQRQICNVCDVLRYEQIETETRI